jgi:FlaG/FlaF family flagellin (archaellin)
MTIFLRLSPTFWIDFMMKFPVTLIALISGFTLGLSRQTLAAQRNCSTSLSYNRSINSIQIYNTRHLVKSPVNSSEKSASLSIKSKEDYKTQLVKVGDLKTYTHPNNLFSVSMPASWNKSDTSKPEETIVTWEDKTGNAVVSIDIFDNTTDSEIQNNPESLGRFLTKTVNDIYKKSLKNVTVNKPDDLGNGVVRLAWAYESEGNGQSVPMSGTSFIRLDRNRISIFTDIIPTEQFERLRSTLDTIVQSFTVNSEIPLPKP